MKLKVLLTVAALLYVGIGIPIGFVGGMLSGWDSHATVGSMILAGTCYGLAWPLTLLVILAYSLLP